ncbi:MAG: alpha/beta hydrolase fold domain-containing protein, partial [Phycisphaerae bacterium]
MRRSQSLCLLSIALLATSFATAQPTFSGLTYATLGGQPLLLDLYLPASAQPPYPVVVWIHGGGWSGGSRLPAANAGPLTQAGFAVASIDYRLTSQAGQFGALPVTFPAQIHDVKAAVRWLRANASQFDLDRSRFGSWGSSAGGHLSALLGTSGELSTLEGNVGGNRQYTSLIHACVDYFGPTDLINMQLDVATPPGSVGDHDAFNSPESRLIGWDNPGQGIGDIRANLSNATAP